ncbi:maleylpyruvate isomerase N-terminal domain-containing protein [Pilimelia columellifera]
MNAPQFRRHLDDERDLLLAALPAALDAKVPTCPEWTGAELARHVALVYLDKVQCMRHGEPANWPPEHPDEAPIDLLRSSYQTLTDEFDQREPESAAYTWYQPDQTVGFWIRRMAHETLIHRVDAELTAGSAVTAIDAGLALDGIDEVLRVFLEFSTAEWPDECGAALAEAFGLTFVVAAGDQAWTLTAAAGGVTVSDGRAADPAAVVAGDPDPVLRWLWRRVGPEVVQLSGDNAALARLSALMRAVTQ